MTAVNVVLQPDRGIMMTDAAFYDASGTVIGFGMKTFPIPNLKAAIAVRGPQGIVPTLGMEMSLGYPSFDAMTDRLERDLWDWADKIQPHLEQIGWRTVELHIVGWSDRERRPKHFAWTNHPDAADERFELVETDADCGSYAFAPSIADVEWRERLPAQGVFVGRPGFAADFDPLRDGVPFMEAQRRSLETIRELSDKGALSIVGGFITVTEVTAEGVNIKVVHRWPDLAGEAIAPAPWRAPQRAPSFAPTASVPPAGLNRQQRRAWEKRHGKVSA